MEGKALTLSTMESIERVLMIGALTALVPQTATATATGAVPFQAASVDETDRVCDVVEKRARASLAGAQFFADVSKTVLPKSGEGSWRRFASWEELKHATKEGAPNTQRRSGPGGWLHLRGNLLSERVGRLGAVR
jgi:hypothetical protein